jgi:peroxin-10
MSAEPALIINSQLKDIEMREYLRKLCIDFLERVIPPQKLFYYQSEISTANDLIYYITSYISNGSTLGELYCGIKWKLPSLLQGHKTLSISTYIVLTTIFPYLLGLCFSHTNKYRSNSKLWKAIKEYFPSASSVMESLNLFFTSVLFLKSDYYELSKWVLGIKYESVAGAATNSISLRPIGQIIMLRLVISVFSFLYRIYKLSKSKPLAAAVKEANSNCVQVESEWKSSLQCSLCMSQITYPSTPLCGHIFCWGCIIESLQAKPECPVCRKPCLPQQVLLLRNI